jgi:hypothetical protein
MPSQLISPLQTSHRRPPSHVARQILIAFLFTFIAARVLVYLIMARRMPDLYAYHGDTHIHHLNYGIFLLSIVGACLLLWEPSGRWLTVITFCYGIGLALTFDEFGMWLHLTAQYWQRASFDAVIVIAALLGLIAAAPDYKKFGPRHWATAVLLLIALIVFGVLLHDSFNYASHTLGPRLQELQQSGPQ